MSIKATTVNNTVIAYINGKMYQKVITDKDEKLAFYEKAINTNENSEEEVSLLIEEFTKPSMLMTETEHKEVQKEIAESKKLESLLDWMQEIQNNGDEHFEVKDSKLYMKDINITIPEFLALEFLKRRENNEDLESLSNFWKLCALNNDPRCREDLYKFLMNHDMVVTPSGYFVAYRNVSIKEEEIGQRTGNKVLNDFISESFIKVKKQKKGPKSFDVCFDDETSEYFLKFTKKPNYDASKYNVQGNLQEMYDGLSNVEDKTTTVYTDNYTRTMTIVIGEPVSIDRKDCDARPNVSCSKGLHLGSPSFVTKGYFGQEGLICLCNPMHVVAVPYSDGEKLRCCEYLPIGKTEYDKNGKIIPLDTSTFEYEYGQHTTEQLDELISEASFESLKEHQMIPKELSQQALSFIGKSITGNLDKMSEVINSRSKTVN